VLLNLTLFLALVYATVWPHEAGHVVAAWLLGLRVFGVVIGRGPVLLATKRWGTRLEVRASLDRGVTWVGHRSTRFFRLRHCLMVLAGPLVNALLAVALAWPGMPAHPERSRPRGVWLFPRHLFAAANLVVMAGNLLPYKFRVVDGIVPSDGLQLCTTPFFSRATVEREHARYFAMEGDQCLLDGQLAQALQWYRRGLERYPDSPPNGLGVGYALLGAREYAEAWQHLTPLLSRPGLEPPLRALAADARASAALGVLVGRRGVRRAAPGDGPGDDDLLREAEQDCQEALRHADRVTPPLRWSFRGTYGCILIEQGKADEGAALLERVFEAFEALEDPAGQTWCLCYLALAAAQKGRAGEARGLLDRAHNLGTGSVALERLDPAALAGPAAGGAG
jgi:tetratricopeptide (TPR) repeat protein